MTPFGKWKPIPINRTLPHWERVKGEMLTNVADISEVNSDVNAGWAYRREDVDHWQSPSEMMASGAGDCEDFAILKRALIGRGEIVIGRDNILRANHAVLYVDGMVLDCTHDKLLTPDDMPHFLPTMGMDDKQTWIYAEGSDGR